MDGHKNICKNLNQGLKMSNNETIKWARELYRAENKNDIGAGTLLKTKDRTITKRGVMWLGQTCNLKCFFCYFREKIDDKTNPEHEFMSLEKAKKICHTLRYIYGNNAIDIQGGEPTIYPSIYELISYCAEIGLAPTLITNGIVLANEEMCQKFKDAGIKDFLFSIHGLNKTYDYVTGMENGGAKQMKALYNFQKLGIPFRFNLTMTTQTIEHLEEIAEVAIETGARAVNFIAFNPFVDQANTGKRSTANVPKYSEAKKHLTLAIDRLEAEGIECNVRYFPLCMVEERHRKNLYNFQQLSYDHHEWDYNSWTWTDKFRQRSNHPEIDKPIPILLYDIKEYNEIDFGETGVPGKMPHYLKEIDVYEHLLKLFSADIPKDLLYRQNAKLRAEVHCKYQYGIACDRCDAKNICDGFHSDYAEFFGTDEAKEIVLGAKVEDPKYFIKHQEKLVD